MARPSPQRVASLLPSATEIVCALGAVNQLVGVSHECDFPLAALGRPVLTSAKIFQHALSRDIDRDVRRLLKDALAVYDIDVDKLCELAPDVIVTQDLCDVCAVSYDDVCKAAKELANPKLVIVNLHPTRLADIWNDIRHVGDALGRADIAEAVCSSMDARVRAVRQRAAKIEQRPKVLTIEWLEPVMIGGTWMPELVEIAGGEALVARAGDHAPTKTDEELAALVPAPDVVVIKPCGFPIERTLSEMDRLRTLFTKLDWPALRTNDIWIADGNAFFNRPGPRIVDSLEILAACLHPHEFADMAQRHAGSFVRCSRA